MPVSTTNNRISYAGNGVTTAFAFPYEFLRTTDLVVIERDNTTGAETLKVIDTHYTVSGGSGAAGTVTMLSAPAAGKTLVLYNDPPRTQGLDLEENDASPAAAKEQAWDKLTLISQRLSDRMDRAIRLSEGYTSTFDPILPSLLPRGGLLFADSGLTGFDCGPGTAASRAGKYLRFDTNGDPYVVDFPTPAGTLAVSAFAETFLDDSTAQEVRTTIGAAGNSSINVKEAPYSAVGDGVADDSAAIQAAIDAVSLAGGGFVIFPIGEYLLGTKLSVPDYVYLWGVSRFSCKLLANVNGMYLVHHNGSYGGAANLGFYSNGKTLVTGLRLTPADETQTSTKVNQNFNRFQHLHFNSLADAVVMKCGPNVGGASGCWYNTFESCDALFCTRGLWMKDGPNAGSSGVNRNKFKFFRFGGAGSNTGIEINSGSTNTFIGCDFEGIESGVLPNATPTAVKVDNLGTFSGGNNSNRFGFCEFESNTVDFENSNAYTEIAFSDPVTVVYTALPLFMWGGTDASQVPMLTPAFLFQTNSQVAGYNNAELHLYFGKINFPDTQAPSTDVNTLDDYEEGTFTPAFAADGGSGYTYSQQQGRYVKIGKWVFFAIGIQLTGYTGAGTTNAKVTGMPFTCVNNVPCGQCTVLYGGATGLVAGDSVQAGLGTNSTNILLYKQQANDYATFSAANITTGFKLFLTGHYEAAS